MKIRKEVKQLARDIHKAEHIFVSGKINSTHKLEEFYYLLGSIVLTKLENSNTEILNKITKLDDKLERLEDSMKEVSKQQKYLWQTMDEAKSSPFQEDKLGEMK